MSTPITAYSSDLRHDLCHAFSKAITPPPEVLAKPGQPRQITQEKGTPWVMK